MSHFGLFPVPPIPANIRAGDSAALGGAMKTRLVRVIAGVSVGGAVLLGSTMIGSGIAGAMPATTHTTCSEKGTVTFKPGLTSFGPPGRATTETISGTLSKCTGGGVKSATFGGKLSSKNQSCGSGSASGTVTLRWNTSRTSTETLTVTTNGLGSTTYKGKVTAGLFMGDSLSGSRSLSPVSGACSSSSPLTKASFSDTAKI